MTETVVYCFFGDLRGCRDWHVPNDSRMRASATALSQGSSPDLSKNEASENRIKPLRSFSERSERIVQKL